MVDDPEYPRHNCGYEEDKINSTNKSGINGS
jgi:hypothetical protein